MTDAASSSWASGLGLSILASMIGAGSKLCLRKSYTLLAAEESDDSLEPLRGRQTESTPHYENSNGKTLLHCSTPDTLSEETASLKGGSDSDIPSLPPDDDDDADEEEQLSPLQANNNMMTATSAVVSTRSHSSSSRLLKKLHAFSIRAMGMFGMMVLGPACNIYALQFASPSILSPVGGGLTLVWIILMAECTIGEKPRPIQIVAILFLVVGEIVVAFTGDHVNLYSLSVSTLQEEYFRNAKFMLYFICMATWIGSLILLIQYGSMEWRRFAWGVIGGSITGMQNFIKDALAVIHGLANDETRSLIDAIQEWPMVLWGLWLFAAMVPLTGLILLMACMKRYDATYSASMFMGSLVISASVMSAVHYHTFDHLNTLQSFLYPLGLFSMLSGVYILATEDRLAVEKLKNHSCTTGAASTSNGEQWTTTETLQTSVTNHSDTSYGSITGLA